MSDLPGSSGIQSKSLSKSSSSISESNVWTYFKLQNKKEFLAECNNCQSPIYYITPFRIKIWITRHIAKEHKKEILENAFIRMKQVPLSYLDMILETCKICGAKSISASNIENHLSTHINVSDEQRETIDKQIADCECNMEYEFYKEWYKVNENDYFTAKCIYNCNTHTSMSKTELNYLNKHRFEICEEKKQIRKSHGALQTESSGSPEKITKENLLNHFETQEKFGAKCKFKDCQEKLGRNTYIYQTTFRDNFTDHLKKEHKDVIPSIKNNMQENSQNYFNKQKRCKICKLLVSPEDFRNHLSDGHSVDQIVSYECDKYYKEGDVFKMKCAIPNCEYEDDIPPEFSHLSIHIRTSSHKDAMKKMESDITDARELLKDCKILPDGKVQCTLCDKNDIPYLNPRKFFEHIRENHNEAAEYEDEQEQGKPWCHFRWCAGNKATCVHCSSDIMTTELQNLEDHITTHTNEAEIKEICRIEDLGDKRSWIWKYCESFSAENKFVAKCELCSYKRSINLEFIKPKLFEHLNSDECANWQAINQTLLENVELEDISPSKRTKK